MSEGDFFYCNVCLACFTSTSQYLHRHLHVNIIIILAFDKAPYRVFKTFQSASQVVLEAPDRVKQGDCGRLTEGNEEIKSSDGGDAVGSESAVSQVGAGTRASVVPFVGPLSSCTLVEGLLFPVEYYVRTTRRMSQRQRQVDLEAVIHSQLGKSRSRHRGRCGGLGLGCEVMTGASGSPKVGEEFKDLCHTTGNGLHKAPSDCRRNADMEQTCSQPLLPVSRPLVKRLFCSLEVQHFQLPDEEYGRLKQEKLRGRAPGVGEAGPGCPPEPQAEPEQRDPEHLEKTCSQEEPVGRQTSEDVEQPRTAGTETRSHAHPLRKAHTQPSHTHTACGHTACAHNHTPHTHPSHTTTPLTRTPHTQPHPSHTQRHPSHAPLTHARTNAHAMLRGATHYIENPSSCVTDVCSLLWGVSGSSAVCVAIALELTVSLWAPQSRGHWDNIHTWVFKEVPVIQLVPLPGAENVLCVAFGDLEIREVSYLEPSVVQAGEITAVLGLRKHRLVCSCCPLQQQRVELLTINTAGRSEPGVALGPCTKRGAQYKCKLLLSSLRNVKTRQLLKRIHLSDSFPGTVCHKAYSQCVSPGCPQCLSSDEDQLSVSTLVAINPLSGKSRPVMSYCLPPECRGRYLNGDVKDRLIAAVVTPGSLAIWDMASGRLTAMLSHCPDVSWSLFQWAETGACLLAGKNDGTVYIYRYAGVPDTGTSLQP
uniref:Partner and localiser of BRCA2 WD40 domain-containing protein n=1 Tax=Callorhinchus milii TaxID=7868 RepID=A0A4W3JAJ7_CALMI